MIDWHFFVTADGLLTPASLSVVVLLLSVLVLHEVARPRLPRTRSRFGCLLSLVAMPLSVLFSIIVVVRVVQILQS